MRRKSAIMFGIFLLGSGIFLYYSNQKDSIRDAILYSWKLETVLKDKEKFDSILKEYHIHTLYQDFSSAYLKKMDDSFIKEMTDAKVKVYHLVGDPSWGQQEGFAKIKKEIDKVVLYNANTTYHLKGIILDIEPYVSEKKADFEVSDFRIYVDQIKQAYQYIENKNLELRIAIPYWFDSIDIDLLEELIKNTDGISVMNYNIKKTSKNIENEIKFSKKYNKQIDTIYEIEYHKKDYFSTHEEILKDFQKIKQDNSINSLQIAYHHYESME